MWNHEDLEAREAEQLHRLGLRARDSRGRRVPESADPLRTCFQRDRDRILHSSSFRRLQHKTQVFPAATGDHYRTRLTHTLEVSQMARSACLALGLNSDLAETVALAHDLGHPPFGHVGERALHRRMREHGGFRHNAQGLRIVDCLEASYAGRTGLNLCWETRVSLLKSKIPPDFPIANDLPRTTTPYLEGQVVDLCDRIAYVSHDMDDAIRSGLVAWEAFADLELPARSLATILRRYPQLADGGSPDSSRLLRVQTVSAMISILVQDIVHATDERMERARDLRSPEAVREQRAQIAAHSRECRLELTRLVDVLRERFWQHPDVLYATGEATERMSRLFEHILQDPDLLPGRFRQRIDGDGLERTVCDYVSGMTDRYVDQQTK